MTKTARIIVMLYIATAISAACAGSALASRGRVFGASFGEAGSGAGQLSLEIFPPAGDRGGSGLAVDEATHDVYVADTGNQRVDEFTSSGSFVRAWGWGVRDGASEFQTCDKTTGCLAGLSGRGAAQFESPAFVAVDNSAGGKGDVYVSDFSGQGGSPGGAPYVQKFTSAGVPIESWGSEGRISNANGTELTGTGGIAVTGSGELLVGTERGIFEFAQSSGAYMATIGKAGGEPEIGTDLANGLAVDGSNNVYFDNPFGPISNGIVAQGVDKLNIIGKQFNDVHAGVTFITGLSVARSGELYLDEGAAIQVIAASCVSQCAPTTTFASPQLTAGAGLATDSGIGSVYIAETAQDEILQIVPEPPAAPRVEPGSQSALNVSGESATLEASINPRSESSEESTTYYFQYTTEEQFEREGFAGATSTPGGTLTPNFEADPVTARVQGLTPGATYRYRVITANAISRAEGKPVAGELDQVGEEIARAFTTQSLGGFSLLDGRAWELVSPSDKLGALLGYGVGNGGPSVVQAAANGDAVTYLASAPTELGAAGNPNATQVLSTRGGTPAVWASRDINTPTKVATGVNIAQAEEYQFFSSDLSSGIVRPYGNSLDPSLSDEASEQTVFLRANFVAGDPGGLCTSSCYRPLVTGAPGFANVPEGTVIDDYHSVFGGCPCSPQFVGATRDASHIVLTSFGTALTEGAPNRGGLYEWSGGQLQLVSVLPDTEPSDGTLGAGVEGDYANGVGRNAISDSGARVVWSRESGPSGSLFLRDVVGEETVQLGGKGAEFQAASTDDSHVFFTQEGDLYEFKVSTREPLSTGHTTDLTANGKILGLIPGVSEDGSSVYFVAEGVLTGEPNAQGETAQAGQPNLYLQREGEIRLVAVLSQGDEPDWMKNWKHSKPNLKRVTTRVSGNGQWLAFMSERSLTSYDNRDAASGERDEEVFLYDANAGNGRGSLSCVSCDPTGARTHGVIDGDPKNFENTRLLGDASGTWNGRWLAANIPGWVSPVYQSRYLSDSGRTFFNSADALVAADSNGTEDVYEYEPVGVGGCTSAVVSAGGSGGCVDLVSSGTSSEQSAFIDASENGDDVFFFTAAELSKADTDVVPDVYDARVDGGVAETPAPPACEGDACQSPVAAPNDPTPGSLTYSGPGNPVPLLAPSKITTKKARGCTKGKRLAHGRCANSKKKAKKRKRAVKKSGLGEKRGGRS